MNSGALRAASRAYARISVSAQLALELHVCVEPQCRWQKSPLKGIQNFLSVSLGGNLHDQINDFLNGLIGNRLI